MSMSLFALCLYCHCRAFRSLSLVRSSCEAHHVHTHIAHIWHKTEFILHMSIIISSCIQLKFILFILFLLLLLFFSRVCCFCSWLFHCFSILTHAHAEKTHTHTHTTRHGTAHSHSFFISFFHLLILTLIPLAKISRIFFFGCGAFSLTLNGKQNQKQTMSNNHRNGTFIHSFIQSGHVKMVLSIAQFMFLLSRNFCVLLSSVCVLSACVCVCVHT